MNLDDKYKSIIPLIPEEWGQNTLFWIFVKLFIKQILDLKPYPNLEGSYKLYFHAILRVEIMGMIVMKTIHSNSDTITLCIDDGSGSIFCTVWIDSPQQFEFNLGDLVTVRGKLRYYKGNLNISAYSVSVIEDPNAEILHWLDVINITERIYKYPLKKEK